MVIVHKTHQFLMVLLLYIFFKLCLLDLYNGNTRFTTGIGHYTTVERDRKAKVQEGKSEDRRNQ